MKNNIKAGAILLTTFVLGGVTGSLGAGFLNGRRDREIRDAGAPGGFVEQMDHLLAPHDEAQRAALRPFLIQTDQRNRALVDGARREMRVAIDSLRANVAGILDADQLARLDDFVKRPPRGAPPGLGGPGRGGPPPDGGPPGGPGGPPPGGPPPRGGPPQR